MKILVVEDDRKLALLLQRLLTDEGYIADACNSGADALKQASSGVYALVLLDGMLPDLDGLDVCRRLRQGGSGVPILILSARGEPADRVRGLDCGADDYLCKPFGVEELLARIRALLRRTLGQSRLRVGPLEIDRMDQQVRLDRRPVDLTGREYRLFLHLAHRAGRVVTRTELLTQVWSANFDSESNLVEVQISRLRDKLGVHAWMIETVRGQGYRLRTDRAA